MKKMPFRLCFAHLAEQVAPPPAAKRRTGAKRAAQARKMSEAAVRIATAFRSPTAAVLCVSALCLLVQIGSPMHSRLHGGIYEP
jgi:hypothetical protein